MSGSSDAEASACSSDSRYGWPLSGARLVGAGRFTAAKAISAASSDSWADKGGSGVSELTCARILGIRFCVVAHRSQACATVPSG